MPAVALWRRAVAEALGTAALVIAVIGSGIAAERLSTDAGLQLLENSIATALALAVIIAVLQPVSGAHLNPVVTLADRMLRGRHRPWSIVAYVAAQCLGAVAGVALASVMFGTALQLSSTERAHPATLLAEVLATAGLVLVIFGLVRHGRSGWVPWAVAAYIGGAYWFTSSTAFANPAVTLGRVFTDTFAGIAPGSAGLFVLAQLVGGAVGAGVAWVLFGRDTNPSVERRASVTQQRRVEAADRR